MGKNINRNTPSICSGIYSYPADLVEQFNKIWLDLFSKGSSHPEIFVCDQNVLCELLYENYEPYTLLPDEWLYYPKYHKGERGSELLIHHCAVSRYRTKYKYLEDRLSEVPDDNKKAWDK